ncbi:MULTISPECIES: UPF0280 family protein [Fervidobacterium]|uniref:Uncharacterized protein n=1 Tax=Fervidobacterium nodosum (strain ATCC 35602 / DSM 5306 / Rt17-B1) TaxID=381764 RepID=A7HMJ4_FERNB|nr:MULTISPECIES: UPF0280 family protein [Fervidobacterium]ABS61127.1 protein of unknown function DUF375 [Fervidobacterium nodosum Rt17-B1]KAF2961369.1 hypothetical protein AS161_08960 [Fervidobacterium sp. 2310opik-2]
MKSSKIPIVKRFYRESYSKDITGFFVKYKYTDIWVGVDNFDLEMLDFTYETVKRLYNELEDYIRKNKEFKTSLVPIGYDGNAPEIAKKMIEASNTAGVGPMACVAGAFSQLVGKNLIEKYKSKKVIVENGGDIYINSFDETRIGIFSNFDSEFNRLSIVLSSGEFGVCSSSGKIGHSLNFGNADIVTVIAKNSLIADGFATKLSNMVKISGDITDVLEYTKSFLEDVIYGVVIIINGKMGVIGNVRFEI